MLQQAKTCISGFCMDTVKYWRAPLNQLIIALTLINLPTIGRLSALPVFLNMSVGTMLLNEGTQI